MENRNEEFLNQQLKNSQKSYYGLGRCHSVVIKIQYSLTRIFRVRKYFIFLYCTFLLEIFFVQHQCHYDNFCTSIVGSYYESDLFWVNRRLASCKVLIIFALLILLGLILPALFIFTRDVDIRGWEKGKIRNAALYVQPNNDTSFTHVDTNICSTKPPLVVIMVCSDTKNYDSRNAIRDTWASDAGKFNIRVLFLVGISSDESINMRTMEESIHHKDIIMEDVVESYYNLTLKSIFMLKWVKENCMQARFLLKSDDDAYINVKNLFRFASAIEDQFLDTFLVGRVQEDASPHRFQFSKWYIPKYMYPGDEYPSYIHGVAYFMSTYVAEKLYNQSFQNEFIYLEDVYITGICAQQINIKPIHHPLFHFYDDPVSVINCESASSKLIVLSHHTNVYYMYKSYEQLKKC